MTRLSEIQGPSQPCGAFPSAARTALLFHREDGLALGIGAAVADELVAARAERREHFGAVFVEARVDEHRDGQREALEELIGAAPFRGC